MCDTENFKSFVHRTCEYFPCHPGADPEAFSCIFCYCPLYALGDKCGGNFQYLKNGMKSCENCLIPHRKENYDRIMEKLEMIVGMTKKDA